MARASPLQIITFEFLAHGLSYFIVFVFLGPSSRVSKDRGDLPAAFLMLEKIKMPSNAGCLSGYTCFEDRTLFGS